MGTDPIAAIQSFDGRISRKIPTDEVAYGDRDTQLRVLLMIIPTLSAAMCAGITLTTPPGTLFYEKNGPGLSDPVQYRDDQGKEIQCSPFMDPAKTPPGLIKSTRIYGFVRHGKKIPDPVNPGPRSSLKEAGNCNLPGEFPEWRPVMSHYHR